jgi:hypothetical protein
VGIDRGTPESMFLEVELTWDDGLQNFERVTHHLRADAVARKNYYRAGAHRLLAVMLSLT